MQPHDNTPHDVPLKQCPRCSQWKPATTEYFYAEKRRGPNGLCSACKICESARLREANRKWRARNLDEQRERERQVKAENREYYRRYSQEYREANREKVRASLREYARNNRAKRNLHLRRYVARKVALPDNFTKDDWQFALDYFNGCCAVCERPPGLFHTLAMDHWIPLSSDDCPGTVPTNIVPLCHGADGCNNSKNDKDPVDWLSDKFGKKQAKAIASKIKCFFDATSH